MAVETIVDKAGVAIGFGVAAVSDIAGAVKTAVSSAVDTVSAVLNKAPKKTAVKGFAPKKVVKKAPAKTAVKKAPAKKAVKKGSVAKTVKKVAPKKAAKKVAPKKASVKKAPAKKIARRSIKKTERGIRRR